MMLAYETISPKGNLRQEFYKDADPQQVGAMLEQFVINEEWYRVSYHNCFNDEGKPCEPWQTLKQKGEIPEPVI